jgi:hypothetical protein
MPQPPHAVLDRNSKITGRSERLSNCVGAFKGEDESSYIVDVKPDKSGLSNADNCERNTLKPHHGPDHPWVSRVLALPVIVRDHGDTPIHRYVVIHNQPADLRADSQDFEISRSDKRCTGLSERACRFSGYASSIRPGDFGQRLLVLPKRVEYVNWKWSRQLIRPLGVTSGNSDQLARGRD